MPATTSRAAAIALTQLAGYLQELSHVRETLDSRYDDLKSGHEKPIDGEDAAARLRRKSADRRAHRS